MRVLFAAIGAVCLALPCLAAHGDHQLLWEVFDRSRQTTVCTYHSTSGELQVSELDGHVLCPRVVRADTLSPAHPAHHPFQARG